MLQLLPMFVLMIATGITVAIFSRLLKLRQARQAAFVQLNSKLEKRHDVIAKFLKVVRKYAELEPALLKEVGEARQKAVEARTATQKSEAEAVLDGALQKLIAACEAYPALVADKIFLSFRERYASIENSIDAPRRLLNHATGEYNATVARFPFSLFASAFNFHDEDYFEMPPPEGSGISVQALDKPVLS